MKLVEAKDPHLREIMAWFNDEASLKVWGGPSFRYPFNERSFMQDLQLTERWSYALVDGAAQPIGFGQIHQKLKRGHLGRLVVSPEHRRLGYGEMLIGKLMARAETLFACSEYSLYVMRDNVPARTCYKKLGFKDSALPDTNDPLSSFQFMVCKP